MTAAQPPREPWSRYFAPVEYRPRPAPPDPDDAAPVDEDDPEKGQAT